MEMTAYGDAEINALKTFVEDILTKAKAKGASSAEVDASIDRGLSVTVRNAEVETVEFNQDKGFSVTVYFGLQKGTASTTDTSPEAIDKTLDAAVFIAKHTQPDEFAGLADKTLMATDVPDLDLYHPWAITPEEAIRYATEIEAAGLNVDSRINNSEGASVHTLQAVRGYGNSHGFVGVYPGTRHSANCVLIASDNEGMQRDYDYTIARDALMLDSYTDVGKRAGLKTVRRLGGQKIKTQRYPVIFSADVASGLLSSFFSAISGGAIYRKSTFLLDAVGEQIFPAGISIDERPHLPKALGSAPFDAEGVATQNRTWVKDGVVQSYVLGSYSARKLGLASTGNAGGLRNIFVTTSDLDFQGLLKKMDTGFVITELMGHGVNKVTGDYSRGACGFWVEGGEIQHAVEEVTVAGNLKDMYQNIVAIGQDVDTRRNIQTGSILLDSMTVAGS